MNRSNQERLEQLFSTALTKDSGPPREAFLDDACGDDADLLAEVRKLLKVHDGMGSFLDSPPVDPGATVDPDATVEVGSPSEVNGKKIGRYKILQEIGEGGFGFVYMAEQQEPVRRMVALKVIKLGMDTKQVIARFEAERQALALMDHPNIARALDAGATANGRPYFVMELVKGITITEYCDKQKLSTRQRLELFIPVCHAIQHAHQKGIIHRDIKPNNILVTLHDTQAVAKVIDFGIAKATTQRLTEKTLFTEFRQFIGTPEYMSPDQAETSGLDVDTRTDIYSLGVVLYELLTGTTPLAAKTLRKGSYEEIRRAIREVDPPKPSTRLQTLSTTASGTGIAALRQLDTPALAKLMRGDLDWIVMKAMEKDRTRRYATAKDLADDIERHLRREPVLAGPPGVTYKLGKFVQRHKMSVLAGSVVVLALLVGLSLAMVGLVQSNRSRVELRKERDAAEAARVDERTQRALAETSAEEATRQAAKSETAGRFLREMLQSVDPSKALGREVTVRYILDEAARGINQGTLADQPEVEAGIRMTLGETYWALGLYDAAEEHISVARSLQSELLGSNHPDTLRTNRLMAGLLRVKGEFDQAEALLRETVEAQRRELGEDHPETLTTSNELALALWGPGRYEEAETIHRETLRAQRHVLGEDHADTLNSMIHLGAVCRRLGRTVEAENLLHRALERCRRVLGDEHPITATAIRNLGLFLEDRKEYQPAEALFREAFELDRRVLGPDHPQALTTANALLRILMIQGKTTEVRPLLIQRLAHLQRAAERSNATAMTLHAYAWELLNCEAVDLRDPEAALPVAKRAVDLDGRQDANLLEVLAKAYSLTGDPEQAIATQRRAIARALAGGPHNRSELEEQLREYLLEDGDVLGAVGISWDGLASRFGEALVPGLTPGASLVRQSETLVVVGRFEEAAAVLGECLVLRRKALPSDHWLIAETESRLGAVIAQQGQFAEAETLLLEAYVVLSGDREVPSERLVEAIERIVDLYRAWGKPDRAAEWLRSLPVVPE